MPSISEKVWNRITAEYEPSIQTEIAEILTSYEDDERERVRLYILRLAQGNKDAVFELVELANRDYRDIIHWTENQGETPKSAN